MECPITLSYNVCYIHSARSSRGGVTSVSRSGRAPRSPTLTSTLLWVSLHPKTVAARLVNDPSTVSNCTSSLISSGRSSATRSRVVCMLEARRDRTSLPISSRGFWGRPGGIPFLSKGRLSLLGKVCPAEFAHFFHPSLTAWYRTAVTWHCKSFAITGNDSPASYRARAFAICSFEILGMSSGVSMSKTAPQSELFHVEHSTDSQLQTGLQYRNAAFPGCFLF